VSGDQPFSTIVRAIRHGTWSASSRSPTIGQRDDGRSPHPAPIRRIAFRLAQQAAASFRSGAPRAHALAESSGYCDQVVWSVAVAQQRSRGSQDALSR
jgi:hypothetical protein